MKRLVLILGMLTSWCILAAPTAIEHLMRPIYGEPTLQTLNVRGGLDAFSAFTGFIQSTNVTAFTAILWTKIASFPTGWHDGGVLIEAMFTVETARSTSEGGPSLEDLLNDAYLVTPIPLSASGTWQATCLPNSYDCPDFLASQWGYGCYCFNLTTDAPITLTVGGAELYIPATNCMIRNIQAISADRTVTIAASDPNACINFGIAENPLVQFLSAGVNSNAAGGNADVSQGGPTLAEWRMVAVRGRIENGNGIGQIESYNATTHFDNAVTDTHALAHPRSTFAHNSRVRMIMSNVYGWMKKDSTGEKVQVKFFGGKLLRGWLTDGEIERLRDIDAAELRRRGEIQ